MFAHPTDMVAVAAGVARFLAVESCGQCTPCKTDGIDLATLLDRLARSNATAADLEVIEQRIGTVGYGARCYLATQQETVLTSIFNQFRDEFHAHAHRRRPAGRTGCSSPNSSTSATERRSSTSTTATNSPTGPTAPHRQARPRSS